MAGMSEHTLCNRCTLDGLRRAAKRRGARVTIEQPTSGPWQGWTIVRQSDRGPNPTHWLRHVPERCAC
jgi:hypothetical protein